MVVGHVDGPMPPAPRKDWIEKRAPQCSLGRSESYPEPQLQGGRTPIVEKNVVKMLSS
jgi:hypothetical protein